MADLDDIFNNEDAKLSDEELLKYLNGKASNEEMHVIEMQTNTSSFENDAIEGLSAFDNKEKLNDYVQQLNKNLQEQLANKKKRKEKRKIKEIPLSIITIIIILILCVLSYITIHFYQSKGQEKSTSPINNNRPF